MDFVRHEGADPATAPGWASLLPSRSDGVLLGLLFCGVALLYLPTYWDLSRSIWQSPDQSQGPLMLLASLWLMFDRRAIIAAVPSRPLNRLGGGVLAFGLLVYVVGRSQSIWIFEVGSQLFVFSAP